MKPIYIFRHVACEGPGYFAEVLGNYSIPYRLIRIDQGDVVPQDLAGIGGLVFMGGFMSVNDELPWIAPELELIQKATASGLPVLGHCLGGQLIAKALGGEIGANPVKEIGWLPVQKLGNSATGDWLGGLPASFETFHWHGETFSIPKGATQILKSEHCANQAFVTGNTLALQCHVEMTEDMVREWTDLYADELARPSETVQSAEQIRAHLEEKITRLQNAARALYARWLRPLLEL